jgi:hypothetical protein
MESCIYSGIFIRLIHDGIELRGCCCIDMSKLDPEYDEKWGLPYASVRDELCDIVIRRECCDRSEVSSEMKVS